MTGLIAAGAVVTLAGCSTADDSLSPPTPSTAFEHIHGLGADPASGNTYVATHQGVWFLPTDGLPDTYLTGAPRSTTAELTQIGDRAPDAMGFTVSPSGDLFMSGHPDPTEQSASAAPNLGLVSSSDQAQTWDTVSLRGQTDFHDLDTVTLPTGELRVYGYDAQQGVLLISNDSGFTWTKGATAPIRDLTADPSDPDRVIATTADGLIESTDGGRTFGGASDSPVLLLVDIFDENAGGQLVGVDPAGALWRQEESGLWTQTGEANGAPEAFSAVDGSSPWILVADQRGISASPDFGATWTPVLSNAANQ
ncbi:F510_1955 family glycosylhydrolase [Cryobacterium sp. 1639]|uniref:F510_1955 family glycosylhydrolase n=1 Tax=Cryobacterium inferilacus TaxID=2866629 RepID=UPI0035A84F55